MLTDQTFNSCASTNVFAPQFKPVSAHNNFQGSATMNPFVPTMPQMNMQPANFTMNADFKAFVPQQASSTPFTPVAQAA